MTTLVTGASGFLGSYFMMRSNDFLGVDKISSNDKVLVCDLMNEQKLSQIIDDYHVDKIVHLAGVQFSNYVPRRHRRSYFSANIEMAKTVSRVAAKNEIRKIVYVSTDMVYGDKAESPISELTIPHPIGEYGESKLAAEKIFLDRSGEAEVVIFRPRLILGPGRVGTIQKLAELIASPLPMILIGNGKSHYQFVSVDDVCNAILLSLKDGIEGIYNLGSDNSPSLDELFTAVLGRLNLHKLILKIPKFFAMPMFDLLDFFGLSPLSPEQYKIAGLNFLLDTDKAINDLGWKASSGDEDLLFSTLNVLLD